MADPFRKHIRTSLANTNLQTALDSNAERRHLARLNSYASLPDDIQRLRQRAHAVRAETIRNLDGYLAEFIRNAEANGMIVHQAKDGLEAVSQVLELVQGAGARRVVKSKTMVGDEIEINAALEKAGVQVVETDLGEWIVQMRGERPAHILTPAVHLRRQDVARLFQEKIGLPYTEDVAELTAAARRTLRQAFLDADVGISGVNFGVASEGALCLLTNEGNGRMVTTLPPLHIAIMGIERLAPTLDDLALMISLLPRSSSGQKMTVYANLIRGPRRPGEVDGALERHLILLDNGRRAMARSPLMEALYCIRCGACLNECPVFRELGGHAYVGDQGQPTPYSGPIGSVISPGLFGLAEFGSLARATSLCGACQEACPVDIPLPELLLRVRASLTPESADSAKKSKAGEKLIPWHLKLALNLYSWLAASPGRFRPAQKFAGWSSGLASPRSGWLRLPAISGWGLSRDLPRVASHSFHDRWKNRENTSRRQSAQFLNNQPETAENDLPPAIQRPSPPALLDRFGRELEALGGRLIRTSPDRLTETIAELLDELKMHDICAWEASELPAGLLDGLCARGIKIHPSPDPSLRLGLTGVLAAAAQSATLALPGSSTQPQTVSLLPEIHLAVLEESRIVEDLSQLFKLPEIRQSATTTFISGPSRTGDIELTLTIGVHGSCQVIVVAVVDLPG